MPDTAVKLGKSVSRERARETNLMVAEICEQQGDHAEAKRRRDAAIDLKRKPHMGDTEKYHLTRWHMSILGSWRDPIAEMVKSRDLTADQCTVAIMLRLHDEGESLAGTIAERSQTYVDKSWSNPAEGLYCARQRGRMAWHEALSAIDERYRRAVTQIILGKAGPLQVKRLMGHGSDKARAQGKLQTAKALDAANSYFGAL